MQETKNERAEGDLVEKSQLLDIKQNYSLQNLHIQTTPHQKHRTWNSGTLAQRGYIVKNNIKKTQQNNNKKPL